MPTHCTIMRFGFHARRIGGVKCDLFSNHALLHCLGRPHYVWDEYLYSVQEKVEVRVTVSVTVCVVLLCCVGWWWKEGRRWNLVPAHSLLFSKSTKGAARFNVPIRRTNRYQQYYMPSQHGSMSASGSAGPGFNPCRVVNFDLKIFNLGTRRCGDVHFLIARLYITGLD